MMGKCDNESEPPAKQNKDDNNVFIYNSKRCKFKNFVMSKLMVLANNVNELFRNEVVEEATEVLLAEVATVEEGVEVQALFKKLPERRKSTEVLDTSNEMKGDLERWVANVSTELRHISHGSPQIVIQTDASLLGWGGILSDNEIGGRWTDEESKIT
ncbi:unnamed protein product [Mytilus edulis]|uniref:Uncharacterized protein n=1 Tax=Mytilus edulis TaxID=6550 RepID=A0A8S3VAV0_MYTED|nr:unnamed protein product [Mytilus edulis]